MKMDKNKSYTLMEHRIKLFLTALFAVLGFIAIIYLANIHAAFSFLIFIYGAILNAAVMSLYHNASRL